MQVFVTVNGVPVEVVIDEATRAEYRTHHDKEIGGMSRLVSMSKSSGVRVFRNHSGSKSGHGRVIYSRSAVAGGVA